MDTKKLIGSTAYFIINKEIMKRIGIKPAILLQHLIDLEDSYFQGKEFYQQVYRLCDDTTLTKTDIRNCKKILIESGVLSISKKGVPSKDWFMINHECIHKWFLYDTHTGTKMIPVDIKKCNHQRFLYDTPTGTKMIPVDVKKCNHKYKESNKTKNINKEVLDVPSDNDFFGKIFFKIVDNYPSNRIGNRQVGLKKFKSISKEEAKLAATNLKRYLATVGDYTKSLLNYIDQKCYTEEWLLAEELSNSKKQTKTEHDTKFFSTDY